FTSHIAICSYLPVFFFTNPPTTQPHTLSLHDALPISVFQEFSLVPDMTVEENLFLGDELTTGPFLNKRALHRRAEATLTQLGFRSEEHTSELQSRFDLVCRLLLEKKNKITTPSPNTFT